MSKTLSSTFTVTSTDSDTPPYTNATTYTVTTTFVVSVSRTPVLTTPIPESTTRSNPSPSVASVPLPPTSASSPAVSTAPHAIVTPRVFQVHTNVLVGTLFGGLAAGAIIVLVIVFFLRNRLNRSRRNMNVIPSLEPVWEGERKQLMAQLSDAQADRAHLRDYLHVDDAQDPRDVVESFNRVNVSVRNLSLSTSNSILRAVGVKPSWSTTNASNLQQLQQDLDGAAGLVLSEKGAGRTLKDFLPEAFRFTINSILDEHLFRLFHPHVSTTENDLLLNMYHQIRRHDSQLLAARWRCSTYSAIDLRFPDTAEQDWSDQFADDTFQRFSSIMSLLLGDSSKEILPATLREGLRVVGREAYVWNRTTKATFKSLDFRPVVFTSADTFDPTSMTLYLKHTPKESPPRKIIVGVSMALMSTSSVSSGDAMREEFVWQSQAEVLTEGFF